MELIKMVSKQKEANPRWSTHPAIFQKINLKPDSEWAAPTSLSHKFYSLAILKYRNKDMTQ